MWLIGLGSWLLASLSGSAADSGTAQHYLPAAGASLSSDAAFTLLGLLCMVGTLWLVVCVRTSTRAGALTVGVLASTRVAGCRW